MRKWNSDNIIFITTDLKLEAHGWNSDGFRVYSPYKEVILFTRLLREAYFRIPFLTQSPWYNQTILQENPAYIIISDPLITVRYLQWLRGKFPNAQINFCYGNMVGKARHIKPSQIPSFIRIWTYDDYDSKKYGIRLRRIFKYHKCYILPKKQIKYDILFVGKDKGRGKYLLWLEEEFNSRGLSTKFIITPDGRFSRRKPYHQSAISYDQIVELISESRVILNIAMENQKGFTMRDFEALFTETKLITTNNNIMHADFYNPENIFILNKDDFNSILMFVRTPYKSVSDDIMSKYTVEKYLDEITDSNP